MDLDLSKSTAGILQLRTTRTNFRFLAAIIIIMSLQNNSIRVVLYRTRNQPPRTLTVHLVNNHLHFLQSLNFRIGTTFPQESYSIYDPVRRRFVEIGTFMSLNVHSSGTPWALVRRTGFTESECPGLSREIELLHQAITDDLDRYRVHTREDCVTEPWSSFIKRLLFDALLSVWVSLRVAFELGGSSSVGARQSHLQLNPGPKQATMKLAFALLLVKLDHLVLFILKVLVLAYMGSLKLARIVP
ncbi:hypothetical protein NP233_g9366 [Leucocoprinus birnbaumii]|uniref:Uncharacterized protein n=1 Tax=Leucocoprinus birnbaumii TaxID=56174 RepID=A0AAD5VKK5_9AGAR|nr:hypothetical protein NP233_g9366 [Leucocoprinus birnbaumii]